MKKIILTVLLLFFTHYVSGQISFNNYPDNDKNTRFGSSDRFDIFRPSLSVRGFDSNQFSDQGGFGRGLKQILKLVYGASPDGNLIDLHDEVLNNARNLTFYASPSSRSEFNQNGIVLESLAYESLVSYVLKQTNTTTEYESLIQQTALRTFSSVYSTFKTRLTTTDLYYDRNLSDPAASDGVKYAQLITTMARVWDLYFALENAFEKYEPSEWANESSTTLLSKSVRNQLISDYEDFIEEAHYWVTSAGGPTGFGNLVPDRAQGGNWPAKVYAAFGYASLGSHNRFYPEEDDLYYKYREFINRGIKASGAKVGGSFNRREFYWMHQTTGMSSNDIEDNYWAEGPFYFNYALHEIIPFWHALRGTGNFNTYYNGIRMGEDPFHSYNKNKPLIWLADLVTPRGETPAIDDGKRYPLSSSALLEWNSDYGYSETGKKFKFINSQIQNPNKFKVIELAIPKTTDPSINPTLLYGNTTSNIGVENWKTAQIVRSSDLNSYVLLNGEVGNAIEAGEGHEQPDQLQLLFYKGEESFLMDAGYYKGSILKNDKRNRYNVHNVMTMDVSHRDLDYLYGYVRYENRGGMASPYVDPDLFTGRKVSEHPDVTDFYLTDLNNGGKAILLQGKVELRRPALGQLDDSDEQNGGESITADYTRKVLVVKDDQNNIDYIVDYNTLDHTAGNWHEYTMKYHFPKEHPLVANYINNFNGSTVSGWKRFNTPTETFYFYVKAIEHNDDLIFSESTDGDADLYYMEYERKDRVAYTVELGANQPHFNTIGIFTGEANNANYTPISQISDAQTLQKPYQVWSFRQDANTIDVIIMRSRMHSSFDSSDLTFVINDNGYIADLKIDKGNSYGFARLNYNTSLGVWEMNPDYQLNIKHSAITITSAVTLNGNNAFLDAITYNFNNDVTINPGSNLTLGTNTKIVFKGDVSAIGTSTNPIRFTSSDPNNNNVQYDQVLFDNDWNGDAVDLQWVVFEGGFYGARFVDELDVSINNTTFRKNNTGIYAYESDVYLTDVHISGNSSHALLNNASAFYINNTMIEDNGGYGISVWGLPANVSLYTEIQNSVIQNNGNYGIKIPDKGYLSIENSRLVNNSGHEIFAYSDAVLYLDYDYNSIFDHVEGYGVGKRYIYKSTLTSTGENQTSPRTYARRNYWGYYYPSGAMFYGDVYTSPQESTDPNTGLNPTNYPSSVAPSNTPTPIVLKTVATANVNRNLFNTEKQSGRSNDNLLRVKDNLNQLRNHFTAENDLLKKIAFLRSMQPMLHRNKLELTNEKADFDQLVSAVKHLKDFQERLPLRDKIADDESNAASKQKYLELVDDYLRLLELEELFDDGEYKEVIDQISTILPVVENQDLKRSLLYLKLSSYDILEEYASALDVLSKLENLEPDDEIKAGTFQAMDYLIVRYFLEERAGLNPDPSLLNPNTPEKIKTLNDSENASTETEEIPQVFALNHSYPNPFNPSTNISFELPEGANVNVTIYDISGRLISTLVNDFLPSGKHVTRFDAKGLSSGMYIVKAILGNNVFYDKITLIK